MINKKSIITVITLITCIKMQAINTSTPKNLEFLANANVSGCVQDNHGAIWLNSNRGFFRYNGRAAEYFNAQMGQTNLLCGSDGRIYGLEQDYIKVFDSNNLQCTSIKVGQESCLTKATMAVQDTTLFVGSGNKLFRVVGGEASLIRTFDPSICIRSLYVGSEGRLLIGTDMHGLIGLDGNTILGGINTIMVISSDGDDGILIGTQRDGLYLLRQGRVTNFGRGILYNIRSVIKENDSSYLIGTADGLFRMTGGGILAKEKINGVESCPICSMNRDSDGNLWISTYYNGLLLSEKNAVSYHKYDISRDIQNIRDLKHDSRGNVFLATDGNGIWMSDTESVGMHRIKNTEGYKFQCAWYDEAESILWASDFHGKLLSIDPASGVTGSFPIKAVLDSKVENIVSIKGVEGNLYLAGIDGIYVFDPTREREVARRIPGIESRFFDIAVDGDGVIWAAGYGLYKIEGDRLVKVGIGGPKWADNATIADIEIDEDGRIWLAYFRRGVVCKDGDDAKLFVKQNCSLIDDYCTNVIPLGSGKALVSTDREISEISIKGRAICFPTVKTKHLLKLDDGRVFAAGNDGILIIDPSMITEGENHRICIDKISVNDKRFDGNILPPGQNGFSFEITTFDYPETEMLSYFCRLKGFEDQWKRFDIKQSVSYMNMKPGKYLFEVQSRTSGSELIACDSFSFQLKPYWWNTVQAYILFTMLVLTVIGVIIYFMYIKKSLTKEIAIKEKENKEKTMFFINLSYKLRTPLNLAIGNLERYFNKYGARTVGVENLEDVYNKANEMRSLISEHVDTRHNQLEDEGDKSISKDAKFLNAAIGVVERNLFSPDLNVSLLCEELNMGKTNLTWRIEEVSGMTPRAFIEDIKLKHAAQMLKDGTYRISEIADLLNFCSPKYFAQRFKLRYGITPKDYGSKK